MLQLKYYPEHIDHPITWVKVQIFQISELFKIKS